MKENDDPGKSAQESGQAPDAQSNVDALDDILRTVRAHVRGGKNREAYFVVQDASVEYPDEPIVLSYYGWLQALVDRRYRPGVDKCKLALTTLQKGPASGKSKLYPVLYLNLGRAYVAANKKKEALEAFHNGLKYDKNNREILQELQVLGSRKKAPVPFLDRANPINKYVGLVLHPAKESADKKK